jgi:hypothetical protein
MVAAQAQQQAGQQEKSDNKPFHDMFSFVC